MKSILVVLATTLVSLSVFAVDEVQLGNAIISDYADVVKNLVDKGEITVNDKIAATSYPSIPLVSIAAKHASLKVLKYLIEQKADLNAMNNVNESALMLASFFKDETGEMDPPYVQHEKAVHMLVEAGANLESVPDWWTPMTYAAWQGHTRILSYLLAKGAKVDSYAVNGRTVYNTPLMMSALNGVLEGTLIILRAGADAKIVNGHDKTALMLAKQYMQKEMVPYLICAEKLEPQEKFSQKCE